MLGGLGFGQRSAASATKRPCDDRRPITIDDVASEPRPGMTAPCNITISADDRYIGYLLSKPGTNDQIVLFNEIEPTTGSVSVMTPFVRDDFASSDKSRLTLAESLRRERARSWGNGVTSFSWGERTDVCLMQVNGSVYVQRGLDGPLICVIDADAELESVDRLGPVIDPRLSPDEQMIAFVRGEAAHEVHTLRLPPQALPPQAADSGAHGAADAAKVPRTLTASGSHAITHGSISRQVTHGASTAMCIAHGVADFCAQEEMHRHEGYWWSPDSRFIAFQETDEKGIAEFTIINHLESSAIAKEVHRYPFAGGANAIVRIGVARADGAAADEPSGVLWLDLGLGDTAWDLEAAVLAETKALADGAAHVQHGAGEAAKFRQAEAIDAEAARAAAADALEPAAAELAPYGRTSFPRFADGYVVDVLWGSKGALFVQVQDRSQRRLRLLRFSAPHADGSWVQPAGAAPSHVSVLLGHIVLEERSPFWVSLRTCLRPLSTGGLIWASERTGYLHLYCHSADGECEAALTAGDWIVDSVHAVDERAGLVYFSAARDDVRQRNLFRAPLCARAADGTPDPAAARAAAPPSAVRLTHEDGWHDVVVCHKAPRFVDVFCALAQPYRVTLRSLADGALLANIFQNADPRVSLLALTMPEMITITNRHGHELHGHIYHPPARFRRPRPLIVSCYGGPDIQIAINNWGVTASLREQFMAQEGYIVLRLDNRGSARRGTVFEQALHGSLGIAEVDDQIDGARFLIKRGLADAKRVGVIGWSYGGYLALLCLARAKELFKAAVAGAPVTDWDGYDTHYTERYMGTPADNPSGYARSSVITHIPSIGESAQLLLVHGLLDENVHFRHTARLINELIRHKKQYELLLFPSERHTPRMKPDRAYMEQRIADFFQRAFA